MAGNKEDALKVFEITKEELSRIVPTGYGSFSEEYVDIDYDEIKKSVPVKENFIRISCDCCFPEQFYNFRLQTSKQKAFFYLCTALGDINDVWAFLEDICKGNDFSFYLSEQEGPFALLIAKRVDKDNIRVALLNCDWYESVFNSDERKMELFRKRHKDKRQHLNFDVIVNRRDFVYTFYICLTTIFGTAAARKIKVYREPTDFDEAQTDSEIIREYLGFVPAEPKDLELFETLKTFDLRKIENALKKGANPNAIIPEKFYSDSPMTEAFLRFTSTVEGHVQRKTYAVIKLLVGYGAKTLSIYRAIWGNWNLLVVKHLIKNNCVFDDHSIGDVETDAWYIDPPEAESSRWYQKLLDFYENHLFNISNEYINSTADAFIPRYGYYGEGDQNEEN